MELKVGDAMTKGVIYASPKDNIQRIADIMGKNDIDSVIVMEKGKGVGIVTDSDIIAKVVATGKDPKTTCVSDIMTLPLITTSPDKDIDNAARMMRDKNIKRLVVVQNNRIVGILSEFDLVKIEPALHILIKEHSKWDIADIPSPAGTISGNCESCSNYSEKLTNIEGRLLCEECAGQD
ncbi:MAG: CBS domain-containing protein [Candidatus Altiarchaeota archaeon]|nr:CBS domain-containing protein [Candidatus Altiarchaeota archaeon]